MLLSSVAAVLVVLAAPAGAQDYTGDCSVSATYDVVEGVLTVVGSDLDPGVTTPVLVDGTEIGEATADDNGDFTEEFEVALDGGTHQVSIFCDDEQVDGSDTEVEGGQIPNGVHVIDPATIDCRGVLSGFAEPAVPGSTVTFTIDQGNILFASVTADANGRAPYSGQVNLAPGNYTITSRGTDAAGDPFAITTGFTVRNNCPAGGAPLSRTGSDSGPAVLAGLGAIVVGSGAVLVSRRKRTEAVAL